MDNTRPSTRAMPGAVATAGSVAAGAVTALGLAHILEIPGKHRLDATQFLAVHHGFYGGYAVVGGVGEVGGLLAFTIVAVTLRTSDRRGAIRFALAAGALAATLVVFWAGLAPLNARIAGWTATSIPIDWGSIRNRWELWHAVTFVLSGSALVVSLAARRHLPTRPARSAPTLDLDEPAHR